MRETTNGRRSRRATTARRAAVGTLAVLALLVPGAAFALDAPGPGSTLVPCSEADQRVRITQSSHLDPSCTYTEGFDIVASDVVLDCRNALVQKDGGGRGIEVSTPVDVDLSGVTVRNCRVDGFLNSFRATRVGFRDLAEGDEYDHHLSDVTVEHSTFTNSRGVGVYVDGYVSGVTLRDLTVTGAGSAGIYLEAGSKGNTVADNVVHDNGFRENGPHGSVREVGGVPFRFWGIGREGLAIDGSYDNHVSGNSFAGNSAGGIFLYTNCGEFVRSEPERWFERRTGADDNVIEDNSFTGGVNGVWVGSRMGENTFPMECSNPPYLTGPGSSVTLDRAARNVVRDNTFDDVTYGVRVEDDGTQVVDNVFTGPDGTHHAVVVGTRYRTGALDHPVRHTTVTGNVATIAANAFPYRWNHGVEDLTTRGNLANGRAVGLCRGTPLPHTAVIFVLAAAPENPQDPPEPPPGLAAPTVGVLPRCVSVVPGAAARAERDAKQRVVRVPVTLSAPSADPVTARWSTIDLTDPPVGIAIAPTDYAAASGTVTFAPGQTRRTVRVTIRGDALDEPDEVVLLGFSDPTNGGIGGLGLGIAAILDDDGPS
jgi:parallel beta-helix repeat protein